MDMDRKHLQLILWIWVGNIYRLYYGYGWETFSGNIMDMDRKYLQLILWLWIGNIFLLYNFKKI